MQQAPRSLFILIFFVSGFSGLIYESIWSHYLKLFLGHAAYAQSLVLMIFMGGMAIGAALAGRWSERIRNPLRAYAWIELAIGFAALGFHAMFVSLTDFAFADVIPALDNPGAILVFKWVWAGGFILPQSILLGATFPLMTTGLLRRYQANRGATISLLYFANSLGGAAGVLISGFVLIDALGLPGTVVLAGIFNIGLALLVAILAPAALAGRPIGGPAPGAESAATGSRIDLWLSIAFLTGAASFIYEIGWIRMLSLVLGSSTHAFELMLSAFILGIALGGLWIRNRIDGIADRAAFLGVVQILMGVMAAMTVVLYGLTFEWMSALVGALPKTEQGYWLFNLGSHAIALIIMAPVTFFAGMTLPLLTQICIQGTRGEASVGAIYAANTLGAILGVLLAVHVGLPLLGLKGTLLAGSAIDVGLGLVLLTRVARQGSVSWRWGGSLAAVLALVVIGSGVGLDFNKLASGVYRGGSLLDASEAEVIAYRDGKTASISVVNHSDRLLTIRTNGKTDAGIGIGEGHISNDEATMTLAGVLPVILHGQVRDVANIGFGSGMTTHSVLGDPAIRRLDNIEIEPRIVELAESFRPVNERAYSDPRNRFHYDDAKTFFSMYGSSYDLIISEPSNPWVSGVSNLFTEEFYRHVVRYMKPGGLFVQWVQFYESDFTIASSILRALDRVFDDYSVFIVSAGDLLVVASPDRQVPDIFQVDTIPQHYSPELARIDIHHPADLHQRLVGTKALLAPLWAGQDGPVNSDYYPFVDQNAARARFLSGAMTEFLFPFDNGFPTAELFWPRLDAERISSTPLLGPMLNRVLARAMRDYLLEPGFTPPRLDARYDSKIDELLSRALSSVDACRRAPDHGDRVYVLYQIMARVMPFLSATDLERVWRALETQDCVGNMSHEVELAWLRLLRDVSARDWSRAGDMAERILEAGAHMTPQRGRFLLNAALGGRYLKQDYAAMRRLWASYAAAFFPDDAPPNLAVRLLMARAQQAS